MKILVVSLLRLGDILLAAPTIAALRKKFPDAQIDLLINKAFHAAGELIAGVDKIHLLDRQLLQEGLVDPDRSLFEPFYRLEKTVDELRAEKYQMCVNLTQNRLSGYLCASLGIEETAGLSLGADGRASYGSPWFKYLNDRAEARGGEIFHYADIFRFGAGVGAEPVMVDFPTTAKGEAEADSILKGQTKFILIQPFTSDAKKDWGDTAWVEFFASMREGGMDLPAYIMGAPFEAERVRQLVDQSRFAGAEVRMAICSLAAANSLLKRASLLVTGDTSIKHLASGAGCPVIELSMGSSDYRRTGIYKDGCWILQAREACAPCPHSMPCHRESHACAEKLSPQVVAQFAALALKGDSAGISRFAENHSGSIDFSRTVMSQSGFWQAVTVGKPVDFAQIKSWIDKVTLKLILQGEHLKTIGDFGTEGFRLSSSLKRQFPQMQAGAWTEMVSQFERESAEYEFDARDATQRFDRVIKDASHEKFVNITEMRKMQQRVDEVQQRLIVRRKLLRTLKDTAMEAI